MTKDERIAIFVKDLGHIIDKETIVKLDYENFFTAPASRSYHGAYEGGLFDHSYTVAKTLQELTTNNHLEWERKESPLIIGYLHDICKHDQYILDKANKKYIWNENQIFTGHATKSLLIIDSYKINITKEERQCIRWHMGAFDDKENWQAYSDAVRVCHNVLWTHHADMIASQIKGI